ncbi:MAG: BamA/TamA family outer membrane protein, partial [Methylocystis sp.]
WDYRGPTNFSKYLYGVPNLPCVYPYTPPNYGQGSCMIVSGQEFRLRSSVGAGLLWQSPLGPIRFDYAVATSKGPFDVTQRFRFTGGTSF